MNIERIVQPRCVTCNCSSPLSLLPLSLCLYPSGSYLGLFQAINVGRRGRSLLWRWAPEKDGFMGYLYYLVGAAVFNVSCAEPLEMFEQWPTWRGHVSPLFINVVGWFFSRRW